MADKIDNFLRSGAGAAVAEKLGLVVPDMSRFDNDPVFLSGEVLLGAVPGSGVLESLCRNLAAGDVSVSYPAACGAAEQIGAAAKAQGLAVKAEDLPNTSTKFAAAIFDGTGLVDGNDMSRAYQFFKPVMRRMQANGRILILSRPHLQADTPEAAAAQRGLEGLCRSIAKESGKKAVTANLISVEAGAEDNIDAALRFFLSRKSAYVDAQPVSVRKTNSSNSYPDWLKPLDGKVAVVTGASRGIGKCIAEALARDGAKILGIDIPPAAEELGKVMAELGGEALALDITAEDAAEQIAAAAKPMGGVDSIVHNAGVTRDKMLANMSEQWWDMTLDINLAAAQRINRYLLDQGLINDGGRIIGVSSMNGIAGQKGQSNYASSKAGVIGYVEHMARDEALAAKNITVNAVAPGFIETQMTAAIPVMTREIGRRLNSLAQGGQPGDVAEAIAMFANPSANGVSGNTLRVCGQNWLGA